MVSVCARGREGHSKMKARDVMVSPVVTGKASSTIREVAKTLLERRISAVPVVDDNGTVVGIVSEGDLLRRAELKTDKKYSWWLQFLMGDEAVAAEFAKSHARTVGDVMTRSVITAPPDTPLGDIAALLEKNAIKRVPIVKDGKLVGIVSRANLVQAIASAPRRRNVKVSDAAIRESLMSTLRTQRWAATSQLTITVHEGVVNLWGVSSSEAERQALRIAAENTPGVRAVHNNVL